MERKGQRKRRRLMMSHDVQRCAALPRLPLVEARSVKEENSGSTADGCRQINQNRALCAGSAAHKGNLSNFLAPQGALALTTAPEDPYTYSTTSQHPSKGRGQGKGRLLYLPCQLSSSHFVTINSTSIKPSIKVRNQPYYIWG